MSFRYVRVENELYSQIELMYQQTLSNWWWIKLCQQTQSTEDKSLAFAPYRLHGIQNIYMQCKTSIFTWPVFLWFSPFHSFYLNFSQTGHTIYAGVQQNGQEWLWWSWKSSCRTPIKIAKPAKFGFLWQINDSQATDIHAIWQLHVHDMACKQRVAQWCRGQRCCRTRPLCVFCV